MGNDSVDLHLNTKLKEPVSPTADEKEIIGGEWHTIGKNSLRKDYNANKNKYDQSRSNNPSPCSLRNDTFNKNIRDDVDVVDHSWCDYNSPTQNVVYKRGSTTKKKMAANPQEPVATKIEKPMSLISLQSFEKEETTSSLMDELRVGTVVKDDCRNRNCDECVCSSCPIHPDEALGVIGDGDYSLLKQQQTSLSKTTVSLESLFQSTSAGSDILRKKLELYL